MLPTIYTEYRRVKSEFFVSHFNYATKILGTGNDKVSGLNKVTPIPCFGEP